MLKSEPVTSFLTLALLVCVMVACEESASRDKTITLKSPDGKFQLTVPDGWTSEDRVESDEVMKVVNKSAGIVVSIAFENKVDLADGLTLDKYADLGRNQLLKKGVANDATMPKPLTVNGSAALQYEAKVTRDNAKYIDLVTTIDAPERFYRINAVVPPSEYEKHPAVIKDVSSSFRAVSDSNNSSSH